MIIANGHICAIRKTGGGIDPVTRHPDAPSVSYGSPVLCQFRPANLNLQSKSLGEPNKTASYEILIEGSWDEECEQIRLYRGDRIVAEAPVISIEELAAVCQTRLII